MAGRRGTRCRGRGCRLQIRCICRLDMAKHELLLLLLLLSINYQKTKKLRGISVVRSEGRQMVQNSLLKEYGDGNRRRV